MVIQMDNLENARKEINDIDKQMMDLFIRRMRAAENIAQYKKERGLPVYDPAREEQIFNRHSQLDDKVLEEYYRLFLKDTIDISKQYQSRLNAGLRIAYSGVEGAYANIAAKKIFPDSSYVSFTAFDKAYQAVESGECDCCVLPIENSYAGEVGQVIDLLYEGSLFLNGIYSLKIVHNLIGLKGTAKNDIRKVISHPQALAQCRPYIEDNNLTTINAASTAAAAVTVKESGDKTLAAIASEETASIYDLEILERGVNKSDTNATKFAVLSRAEHIPEHDNKFIMMFTVKQVAGALLKAINVISKYGFNMQALRSRPMKEPAWQYYFYVEAEGDDKSQLGQIMLSELSAECEKLKVVGHYSEVVKLN